MVKQTILKNKKEILGLSNFKNYLLVGICGVLALSSILLTVDSATSGMEVAKLQKDESNLDNQKRILEESLVKSVSISDLQQKSGDMGFAKPANLVYIQSVEPVARLP